MVDMPDLLSGFHAIPIRVAAAGQVAHRRNDWQGLMPCGVSMENWLATVWDAMQQEFSDIPDTTE
jgi:hypothetical protein